MLYALSVKTEPRFLILFLILTHSIHMRVPRLGCMRRFLPLKGWPHLHLVFFWLWSRPLASLSRLLSVYVPRNRCLGLTHPLLSHLWHTHRSPGSVWFSSIQAIRCAMNIHLLPFHVAHLPYPFACLAPIHSQHSSMPFMFTFDQNFCMAGTYHED